MNFSKVLLEEQIDKICNTSEQLLESTGFKVEDDDALRRCAAAGAKVNQASGIVRLPRKLLHQLLELTPSSYTIGSVENKEYEIGGEQQWGLAIVTDPWIIDYDLQRPRHPCLADLRRNTAVAQSMEHIAAISRMDFPVSDIQGSASSMRAWEQYLLSCGKHHWFMGADPQNNRRWLDIVHILSHGEDPALQRLFTVAVAVTSPLKISGINLDLLRTACKCNAPVVPTICPMAGSTSPYSLASTLMLGHAENLFVAALTQIFKPGLPFLYLLGPSIMDMRSGHDLYYTLDKVLWKVAHAQLARSYNLPVAVECGGTMTYRFDQQNGMESAMFMVSAVASRASLLGGFGSCYNAVGMSAEMMVIQEAWMKAIRFLQKGIDTDDACLGLTSIQAVGPGGLFLTDELTLRNIQGEEFFANELFDRCPYSEDARGMLQRAHEKVEKIVADFESPVPHDIQEKLRRYFHDECQDL